MTMTLSEELKWRGFINQTTYKDISILDKQTGAFYHGFDASADSQTIGNLAAMMFDKLFMRHGWKAVVLAGGATSLIGDPGGKDSERVLQDETTIARNVENAKKQLTSVFLGQEFKLVNNLDWIKDMTVIEFLRDIGKHYSMTPLIQRDYIAKRIGEGGSGISYTEFSYTLLQGLDYLHLYDTEGVTLQLGGSDQWGNCLSGVDLVRRARNKEVHVITLPLIINKTTGKKFGKSEEGAVWLDSSKTSVDKFYQFWLNSDDEGVEGYLKIFTELDKLAIDAVMQEFKNDRSGRAAQKLLAYEVTKLVHGEHAAEAARSDAQTLFAKKDLTSLTDDDFESMNLPVVEMPTGTTLFELTTGSGLAKSNSEVRRLLSERGLYLNDKQLDIHKQTLDADDFIGNYAVLRRGKNTQVLIKKK